MGVLVVPAEVAQLEACEGAADVSVSSDVAVVDVGSEKGVVAKPTPDLKTIAPRLRLLRHR